MVATIGVVPELTAVKFGIDPVPERKGIPIATSLDQLQVVALAGALVVVKFTDVTSELHTTLDNG